MQKVFIRGVEGRGKEVIAKLEALGGNNNIKFNGENEKCIYFIDDFTTIQCLRDNCETANVIMMAYTEIFLDDKEVNHEENSPKIESTKKIFNLFQKVKIKREDTISKIISRYKNIDDGTMAYVLDDVPNTTFFTNELEEVIEEQKSTNTLKEYDPVMVSDDGYDWHPRIYSGKGNGAMWAINDYDNECNTEEFNYIVPHSDFDFTNLKSNIKRSIV